MPTKNTTTNPTTPTKRDVGTAGIISGLREQDMTFTGRGGSTFKTNQEGYRLDDQGQAGRQWISPTGEVWLNNKMMNAAAGERGQLANKDWDWYESELGLDRNTWNPAGAKPWDTNATTGSSMGLSRAAMRNLGFEGNWGGGRGAAFGAQVGQDAINAEVSRIQDARFKRQRELGVQAATDLATSTTPGQGIGGGGIDPDTGLPTGDVFTAIPSVAPQIAGALRDPNQPGIISSQVQDRLEQVAGPTPANQEYATQTGMTAGQDVNWQIQRIMSADNPLISNAMEKARSRAYDEANARGLLNTSMAVEAAEKAAQQAAYDIALPMAQDAARAEQDISKANLASRSSFQQLGVQVRSHEALQNSQLAAGEIIQTLSNNNAITLKEIDRITSLQGIQLEEASKRYMHQITESNKLALQTNASVATAYSNTVSAIGQVYQNPEMLPNQQDAAARWYMDQFQSYTEFQDVVNKTNYADQLDWGTSSGAPAGTGAGGDQYQQAPDQYGPFGVVGAPGETRTINSPGSNRQVTYNWNSQTQTWQQSPTPQTNYEDWSNDYRLPGT